MAKHPTEPFRIDDSRMPLRLGSALRVPSYAYPNWVGAPEGPLKGRMKSSQAQDLTCTPDSNQR